MEFLGRLCSFKRFRWYPHLQCAVKTIYCFFGYDYKDGGSTLKF
jgi:hypothetical protein